MKEFIFINQKAIYFQNNNNNCGDNFCLDQVLHLQSFLAWRVPHWKESLPLHAI